MDQAWDNTGSENQLGEKAAYTLNVRSRRTLRPGGPLAKRGRGVRHGWQQEVGAELSRRLAVRSVEDKAPGSDCQWDKPMTAKENGVF